MCSKKKKRNKIKRKKNRASQTDNEKKKLKEKDRHRKAKHKVVKLNTHKKTEMNESTSNEEQLKDEENKDELLSDETISKAKAEALEYLHQTYNKATNLYQANVCIVCDCFILGTEPVKRLKKGRLNDHKKRLGVENYKTFYKLKDIPKDLRLCFGNCLVT